MSYLMKCGHVANGWAKNRNPACAICGCIDVVKECKDNEGLEGRKAKCGECGSMVSSSWNLPFFEYKPDKEYDTYYCGCWGWD